MHLIFIFQPSGNHYFHTRVNSKLNTFPNFPSPPRPFYFTTSTSPPKQDLIKKFQEDFSLQVSPTSPKPTYPDDKELVKIIEVNQFYDAPKPVVKVDQPLSPQDAINTFEFPLLEVVADEEYEDPDGTESPVVIPVFQPIPIQGGFGHFTERPSSADVIELSNDSSSSSSEESPEELPKESSEEVLKENKSVEEIIIDDTTEDPTGFDIDVEYFTDGTEGIADGTERDTEGTTEDIEAFEESTGTEGSTENFTESTVDLAESTEDLTENLTEESTQSAEYTEGSTDDGITKIGGGLSHDLPVFLISDFLRNKTAVAVKNGDQITHLVRLSVLPVEVIQQEIKPVNLEPEVDTDRYVNSQSWNLSFCGTD